MTMSSINSRTTLIVPFLLEKDKKNYENWKFYIKNYLLAQDLWDIVEYGNILEGNWRKKNAAALHAILCSCSLDISSQIKDTSAKDAWKYLAKMPEEREPEEGEPQERSSGGEEINRPYWLKLTKKIYKGDWQDVREFIFDKGRITFPQITGFEETALHVAIKAEQDKIVKELIEMMSIPELEKMDCNGHTALSLVAFEGRKEWAELLVQKNQGLLTIADKVGNIPLTRAANYGREEMTHYLYDETLNYIQTSRHDNILQPGKEGNHGFHLLRSCIANKMFDICWHLLRRYPSLAVGLDTQGVSPILMLSSQPSAFYSGTRTELSCWERWIYHNLVKVELPTTSTTPTGDVQLDVFDQSHDERNIRKQVSIFVGFHRLGLKVYELTGIKKICDLKLRHHLANEVLLSMFQHRQEKVFNLIYGVNQAWNAGHINKKDIDGNNILHIAGGLAPDFERAGISSSPALQIQRELQWFKAVESIVPEWCKEAKNNNDQTPKDVFTKSHKELVKEGQKWMADTASSFIILSILLVTVTFAVSFTVPGGNNQTTGFNVFGNPNVPQR
ncbi:hypothetical protein SLEP1_g37750 [Rubroshorea leprosula]|uniref:PGG domain-containing protein n=1 Tax=Rubroshorea leprosula TaxID=152421 RepID=A0AAV5KVP8_9ROSI|nr:hypothetical protein SLEP1_g37750 [Rubroshorea leprosula]